MQAVGYEQWEYRPEARSSRLGESGYHRGPEASEASPDRSPPFPPNPRREPTINRDNDRLPPHEPAGTGRTAGSSYHRISELDQIPTC
jgi:hypothetical protein